MQSGVSFGKQCGREKRRQNQVSETIVRTPSAMQCTFTRRLNARFAHKNSSSSQDTHTNQKKKYHKSTEQQENGVPLGIWWRRTAMMTTVHNTHTHILAMHTCASGANSSCLQPTCCVHHIRTISRSMSSQSSPHVNCGDEWKKERRWMRERAHGRRSNLYTRRSVGT